MRATLLAAADFAAIIARPVASDWPPMHWDKGAVDWLCAAHAIDPQEHFWRAWLIALRANGPIIGTVGCKGPPDSSGAVEIGYSVVPSHQRRGIVTEAAAALVEWILTDPRVRTVRAHTLANDPASSGVLRKLNFAHVATLEDPTDGTIDRFERPRG